MRVLTEHLSMEGLMAAKGQAGGDHVFQVNHAA